MLLVCRTPVISATATVVALLRLVASSSPVLAETMPTGGVVVTGSDNVTSANYVITFSQKVLWTDAVITSPNSYRVVVTFTGSVQP